MGRADVGGKRRRASAQCRVIWQRRAPLAPSARRCWALALHKAPSAAAVLPWSRSRSADGNGTCRVPRARRWEGWRGGRGVSRQNWRVGGRVGKRGARRRRRCGRAAAAPPPPRNFVSGRPGRRAEAASPGRSASWAPGSLTQPPALVNSGHRGGWPRPPPTGAPLAPPLAVTVRPPWHTPIDIAAGPPRRHRWMRDGGGGCYGVGADGGGCTR